MDSVEFYRSLWNLMNHSSMNWDQLRWPLFCLCLCGTLLAPLTLKKVVGSNTTFYNFLFSILQNFYRTSLGKTRLFRSQQRRQKPFHTSAPTSYRPHLMPSLVSKFLEYLYAEVIAKNTQRLLLNQLFSEWIIFH